MTAPLTMDHLHPRPLLCSGCGAEIKRWARCYVINLCEADLSYGGEIGPYGDCHPSGVEPTLGTCCVAPAAAAKLEADYERAARHKAHTANTWWCPCADCVQDEITQRAAQWDRDVDAR